MASRFKFNELLESFAGPRLRKEISAALFAAADDVRARSRRSITDGSVSGINHVASAPGEPPNNDTGNLIASHETAMPEWNRALIVVSAPYAVPLEYGTSRMAARPFLGPATQASRNQLQYRLNAAIQQAARRAEASVKGS